MKTKLLAFILMSAIVLTFVAGCSEGTNNHTSTPAIADTTVSTGTTVAESTAAATTATSAEVDYSTIYNDTLSDIYNYILTVVTDFDKALESDVDSQGVMETVTGLSEKEAVRAVGYTVEDINDDKIPELLVLSIDDVAGANYVGSRILSAYTCTNGIATKIFDGMSRNRYYILEDNSVYNESSISTAYYIFATYTLPAESSELKVTDYYYTAPDDNDDTIIKFYHNTTGDADATASELFSGNEDDFWQVQADLAARIKTFEITSFEIFSDTDEDIEPSTITAVFAKDTLADLSNAQRFTADTSDYETEVAFFASGDIKNFKFCELKWLDDSDSGESVFEFVPMHEIDSMVANDALVVTMTFWGDTPTYGITYTDSEGVEHSATISTSGMDGSLILDVI